MKEQQILSLRYIPSSFALGTAMNTTSGICDKCYKKWKEFWIHDKEKTGEEFLIHDIASLMNIYELMLQRYDQIPDWVSADKITGESI